MNNYRVNIIVIKTHLKKYQTFHGIEVESFNCYISLLEVR